MTALLLVKMKVLGFVVRRGIALQSVESTPSGRKYYRQKEDRLYETIHYPISGFDNALLFFECMLIRLNL